VSRDALKHILWLAYRDFLYERYISLCFVFALMAVLAPLLVLFGLKFGVIDTMVQRLVQSPHNREIIGVGGGRYDEAWFATMAARPDVAFVIPNTRRIAASFTSVRHIDTGNQVNTLQMLPTAPGDPLLTEVNPNPLGTYEVVLSALAARELGAAVGDRLEARIGRRHNKQNESVNLTLVVVGITPEGTLAIEAAFVSLELLLATEDYRDGIAVEHFNWPGITPSGQKRVYPRFRLYAKTIFDVIPLRDMLLDAGIDVRIRAPEIEAMQSLDQNLNRVYWLLATIGSTGFLASLAANLLSNVDRKRKELSLARLLGFTTRTIVLFPVIQAALIAALGGLAATGVYFLVAAILNASFASSLRLGESVCRMLPAHLGVALLITVIFALAASAWAGYRAAQIEPAEGIRDV
jgi:putative ABC transport system permease protein